MLQTTIFFFSSQTRTKAITGLDRESAHPLQLCILMAIQGDNRPVAPGFAAVQQLRFMTWSCNRWADSLSNPVRAFTGSYFYLFFLSLCNDISHRITSKGGVPVHLFRYRNRILYYPLWKNLYQVTYKTEEKEPGYGFHFQAGNACMY